MPYPTRAERRAAANSGPRTDLAPFLDPRFVKWLRECNPLTVPRMSDTERTIFHEAGRQSLIAQLETMVKQQEEVPP